MKKYLGNLIIISIYAIFMLPTCLAYPSKKLDIINKHNENNGYKMTRRLNRVINARSIGGLLSRAEAYKISDSEVKEMYLFGSPLSYMKKRGDNIEFDMSVSYNDCTNYLEEEIRKGGIKFDMDANYADHVLRQIYILKYGQIMFRETRPDKKDYLIDLNGKEYMDGWEVLRDVRQQFVDCAMYEDKYSLSTICFKHIENQIISFYFYDIGSIDEVGKSPYEEWHLAELRPEVFCTIKDNGEFIYPNTCPLSECNILLFPIPYPKYG